MKKVLAPSFFNRPTVRVAKDLLGKFLVRRRGKKQIAVMIAEAEAYDGPYDKASHASRGRTKRNEMMFGEAARFYVYFTYGMHWILNIVTGPKNYPAAILIRAAIHNGELINGPGRLTKYLKINKRLNGKFAIRRTGLWIEDRGVNPHTKRGTVTLIRALGKIPRSGVGVKIKPFKIIARKRIGVDYAGAWVKKLYNFSISGRA